MVLVLVIGNIIVVKLSVDLLINVILFVEIVYLLGLLKGVFNLVYGVGGEIG